MPSIPHWADLLRLRREVTGGGGQVADLRMSLYNAVYQTHDVPYQDAGYYADITEPTPGLVGFMADIARRLGAKGGGRGGASGGGGAGGPALFHLEQGMGGGKSHALVGLYHLGAHPERFLATALGERVRAEAENRADGPLDLTGARVVVLSADNMSPGVASPEFGPATTLHERFLWSLFPGDRARYDAYAAQGPDKGALRRALAEAGGPVLILLDELMDYGLQLADERHRDSMPREQAFLNSLSDAVEDLPRVAFVVVMIRSDFDERGYPEAADGLREYVARRLERNGRTVSVTDPQDFAAIIRRRLFERPDGPAPTAELAARWAGAATRAWVDHVFERLPSDRGLTGLADRAAASYPFHPDLMALVRDDWSRHAGFQRVRSTVDIFAATAFHWVAERQAGRWAPELINVGDVPLHRVVEQVLSSGLLHGSDKAVIGFRQVAATDVVAKDPAQGRAVELEARFAAAHSHLEPGPRPCVQMATALYLYSLVARTQQRRGATRAELLAAVYQPTTAFGYADADEVFGLLVDTDEGLGSLDTIPGAGGSTPTRYRLTAEQNLRMFYRQAKSTVSAGERDAFVWERVQDCTLKAPFDRVVFVDAADAALPPERVFAEVDEATTTRLVVLDPNRWTLLNGRDSATREDIEALLGLGPRGLRVDNAASVVVAVVNTQRRDAARKRATEALAYRQVTRTLDPDDDLRASAQEAFKSAQKQVDADLRRAYQHYAYLVRGGDGLVVEWKRFDDEAFTALSGNTVWDALVAAGRASRPGALRGDYLRSLLDISDRELTLREVVRRFWQDPGFPLVSGEADVRRAIYEAVTAPHDPWEVVGPSGEVLTIPSPGALAINSAEYQVRPATPTVVEEPPVDGPASPPKPPGPSGPPGVAYKQYAVRLPSTSVAAPDARRAVWSLLSQVADDLDPSNGKDVQLVEVTFRTTAAQGSMDDVAQKAATLGVQMSEEDEDF